MGRGINPISGAGSVDKLSIANIAARIRSQPAALLMAAKTLPSIVDRYQKKRRVTDADRRAAKLHPNLDDERRDKGFFNFNAALAQSDIGRRAASFVRLEDRYVDLPPAT